MSRIATQLDELRDVVGEIDALAALALESFDRADWSDADPLLVERTAYALGMIARSAATAASKLEGFHAAVTDTQPASAGERRGGTAPAKETAMSARDAEIVKRPASFSREADVVKRLRERCAAAFKRPVDYPFFNKAYMPGETPDQALWRIFHSEQLVSGWLDGAVMDALIYGNELPTPGSRPAPRASGSPRRTSAQRRDTSDVQGGAAAGAGADRRSDDRGSDPRVEPAPMRLADDGSHR